ncbi:unnamed protein product [Ectocarpus sp. CCAP 1310/34]|nr:unnamed protein product [Ectocarpus sp. CCAP 1310/34]
MASRFLRADLRRVFRPLGRPTSSNSNAFLSLATTRPDEPSVAPSAYSPSALTAAALDSSEWLCSSVQSSGHAHSESATSRSGSSEHGPRLPLPVTGMFLALTSAEQRYVGCWRGGAVGLGLCSRQQQQAGKRFLSSRSGKAGGQTLTNKKIKAEKILLVLETEDGSKTATTVSRQQALAAANAVNLDLVQVSSGRNDQVVCRLMDFKKEEYRKKKQRKANAKRIQKKKEIRLRGMIADHDFGRKVNDVKKYLERGDVVKVVLEANISLLKRSGNCLNVLQEKFEEQMEEYEGAVLKHSGGGNGYTRREIECIPKTVRPTTAKPTTSASEAPGRDGGGIPEAGEKENPIPPPSRGGVVDKHVVLEVVSGAAATAHGGSEGELSSSNSGGNATDGSADSSREEASGEDSSSDDEDVAETASPLKLGSTEILLDDVELYDDLVDETVYDDGDIERERNEARRREDRQKREEAKEKVRNAARYAPTRGGGGGGGRKKWKAEIDREGGGGGDNFDEESGWGEKDDRRTARRVPTGRDQQTGGRRGVAGGDSRAGASDSGGSPKVWSTGGGRRDGSFPNVLQQGAGSFRRGDRRGSDGGSGPREGPPPSSPALAARAPYKWRTSIADAKVVEAGGDREGTSAKPWYTSSSSAASLARRKAARTKDGGGGAAAAEEVRGFKARFGGGSMNLTPTNSVAVRTAKATSSQGFRSSSVTAPSAKVNPPKASEVGSDRGVDGEE